MFNAKHLSVGKIGENIAKKYLIERGLKIIETNYCKPWGEIDIVAKTKIGKLIFVEVKTLRKDIAEINNNTAKEITPEDNLTYKKLKKLQKISEEFANSHPKILNDQGWQIDLISVEIPKKERNTTLIKENKNVVIKHYSNIS